VIRKYQTRARQYVSALLKEDLTPGRAAAAAFLGLFIGIVPIYGFQTLAAVGVALLFRLNKPLTLAGTFINNPLLQPVIVVSSVELGYFLRGGSFRPFHLSALAGPHMKEELLAWGMGSVVLGVLVGGAGAALTAVVVRHKSVANREFSSSGLSDSGLPDSGLPDSRLRERTVFVNRMFAQCDRADRGFVRWKLRLDRIFELLAGLLATEDLRSGELGSGELGSRELGSAELGSGEQGSQDPESRTVVDLGCGYGMALSFAAFGDSSRRLVGCDLDAHRIAAARQAFSGLNSELSVADVRCFNLPPAGLILILDVLQYLPAEEQLGLLKRCCSALVPRGMLIFRVHDRQRGLRSKITMAFDRLIFACGRASRRPLVLPASEYHSALENSGMQVEERRFRNRLPLAHILFIARKPAQCVMREITGEAAEAVAEGRI
jgi:uncharacterized protein (DUF2062 family)/SAM-dependent methyltransferase